jgi:hypothetical protein
MPRKKIKLDHPDDPERVKAYIAEKAGRSESAALRKFLKEIPNPTSLPLLSQGNNQQDFKLDGNRLEKYLCLHMNSWRDMHSIDFGFFPL